MIPFLLLLMQLPAPAAGAPADRAGGPGDDAGEAAESRTEAVDRVRSRLIGSFVAVERHARGEATGHLVARPGPGGSLTRDYWSVARGDRIYAGHDVLQLRLDGTAFHWWFGSKGDDDRADGWWSEDRLVLFVREPGKKAKRRYTYRFDVDQPLAFHFQNDHADGREWQRFMDSSWRRSEVTLPADFMPAPQRRRGVFSHYAGLLRSGDSLHRGRCLFGDWLVYDTPEEHGVLETGAFGKVKLWLWTEDGGAHYLEGKERRGRIVFREQDAAPPRARIDTLLEGGYLTESADSDSPPTRRTFLRDR